MVKGILTLMAGLFLVKVLLQLLKMYRDYQSTDREL